MDPRQLLLPKSLPDGLVLHAAAPITGTCQIPNQDSRLSTKPYRLPNTDRFENGIPGSEDVLSDPFNHFNFGLDFDLFSTFNYRSGLIFRIELGAHSLDLLTAIDSNTNLLARNTLPSLAESVTSTSTPHVATSPISNLIKCEHKDCTRSFTHNHAYK